MKELIYLDKDYLQSFTVQIKDGFIGSVESQEQKNKDLLGKQYYTLAQFEDYLLGKSDLVNFNERKDHEEVKAGSYVKFTSSFKVINFGDVQRMINDKFIKFLFSKLEEAKNVEVQHILEQTLTTEQRNVFLDELEKTYEHMVNAQKSQIQSIKDMLVYITEAIPFTSFIKMGSCLIPLQERYLRESVGELAFKYSSEDDSIKINLIGKVTKKINKKEVSSLDYSNLGDKSPQEILNAFLGFPTNLLGGFGVVEANDYIVSPVAIYFE